MLWMSLLHKHVIITIIFFCFLLGAITAQWVLLEHDNEITRRQKSRFYAMHRKKLAVKLDLCLTHWFGGFQHLAPTCNGVQWCCEGESSPWAATLPATCGFCIRCPTIPLTALQGAEKRASAFLWQVYLCILMLWLPLSLSAFQTSKWQDTIKT